MTRKYEEVKYTETTSILREIYCDWCRKLFWKYGRDRDVDQSHGEIHDLKVVYRRGYKEFQTNKSYRDETEVVVQWADFCKKCRPKLFTMMKRMGIKIQRKTIDDESEL